MKSLDEHNRDKGGWPTEPLGANVGCPKCETEMVYIDSAAVLASMPPKKTVMCPECGEIGYKIV